MNAPFVAARPAKEYDYLIVGAGFAGSVLAERLASQHGARVLLIDRRPHIGGNALQAVCDNIGCQCSCLRHPTIVPEPGELPQDGKSG